MARNWFWRMTGGRPMRRVGEGFTDAVSGERVYRWECRLGRLWLATSAWSLFRVALVNDARAPKRVVVTEEIRARLRELAAGAREDDRA